MLCQVRRWLGTVESREVGTGDVAHGAARGWWLRLSGGDLIPCALHEPKPFHLHYGTTETYDASCRPPGEVNALGLVSTA